MSARLRCCLLLPALLVATLVQADTLCFRSAGRDSRNTVRLRFDLPHEQLKMGQIRYQGTTADIDVERLSEETLHRPHGAPDAVKTVWVERRHGRVWRKYLLVTAGATIGDLRVLDHNGVQRMLLRDDPKAYVESGCDWESRQ